MRPGTKPSMRSRRACAAPPSRSRRASSIRCWAQWLAAHRASMTRTVGTPHEIEPNTVLGVDSAFGVGELRVAHVCVQCVADQFPHALVWEPCAAERLVGVFLWAAAPPAASPGPLAALSSRRAPCARAKHATRKDQPIVATHGPVGAGRAHREHPADTQGGPRAPWTPPSAPQELPESTATPRSAPRAPPSAFITSCGSPLIASSCPTVTTQLPHSYYTVTTQLPHSYYMRNLRRKRDSW